MKRILTIFLTLSLLACLVLACSDDDGGAVQTCAQLCDLTPVATAAEAQCVGNFMENRGYNIWLNPMCNSVGTESECNACYQNINATDGDCQGAHDACF